MSQLNVRRLLGALSPRRSRASLPCAAQVTPAAGYTPPDDTPSIRVGVTLFADYTYHQQPKIKDADGNEVTLSAFQIGRSYINVTGQHQPPPRSSAITPDIARETGVGSSLNGSYTFRLKYAYAQWNLDDHMAAGLVRALRHAAEPVLRLLRDVYRYRFQGTIFNEREGYQSSADVGAAFRYSLPTTTATSRPASSTARTTTGRRSTIRRRS